MNCLIVDDEPIGRKALGKILRDLYGAVKITECATIQAAQRALKSRRWDLILVDYYLDHGTGIDALTDARRGAPVVLVTAREHEAVAHEAQRAGFHFAPKGDFAKIRTAITEATPRPPVKSTWMDYVPGMVKIVAPAIGVLIALITYVSTKAFAAGAIQKQVDQQGEDIRHNSKTIQDLERAQARIEGKLDLVLNHFGIKEKRTEP